MSKLSIQLKQSCRSLRYKITSIFTQTDTQIDRWTHGWKHGSTDAQTHRWMDRQADSSIPPKTLLLRGYNNIDKRTGHLLKMFYVQGDIILEL